jgi:hypothetical protein
MANCKPAATPMEERLKLSRHNTAARVDAMCYQSIVGGLRYLTHTQSDISFAIASAGSWRTRGRIIGWR